MAEIKAIETVYNGYKFRSRLEARWAVFFDALGIEYEYEKEGFKTNGGAYYLPDFYLPRTKTWVEVKGDPDALCRDYEKMVDLLDWGGVLPNFADSYETSRGLLLLGDIPNAENRDMIFHPLIQHSKGLKKTWAMFTPYPCTFYTAFGFQFILELATGVDLMTIGGLESEADNWVIETQRIPSKKYFPGVVSAYTKARQARFEHGEKG